MPRTTGRRSQAVGGAVGTGAAPAVDAAAQEPRDAARPGTGLSLERLTEIDTDIICQSLSVTASKFNGSNTYDVLSSHRRQSRRSWGTVTTAEDDPWLPALSLARTTTVYRRPSRSEPWRAARSETVNENVPPAPSVMAPAG
jgi:hypothetical protein